MVVFPLVDNGSYDIELFPFVAFTENYVSETLVHDYFRLSFSHLYNNHNEFFFLKPEAISRR